MTMKMTRRTLHHT